MAYVFDIEAFRECYPAFDDDDIYTQCAFDQARLMTEAIIGTDSSVWCGDDHYKAMYDNLVAHFLVVWGNQAAGDSSQMQTITSKTAGGVSVSLEGMGGGNSTAPGMQLQTTSYGQNYLLLKRICRPFAGMTVSTVVCGC